MTASCATSAEAFLDELKHRTRAEHRAIEAALDLLDPGLTPARYRRHVGRLYGYHAPLEARFDALGAADPQRRKLPLLQEDLHRLGLDAAALPLCAELPALDTAAARWGCRYVLEGATLGGQVIGRHVQRRLGIGPAHGARYFAGYGDRTAAMWQTFRDGLTEQARDPASREAIVAAAKATFTTLRQWCQTEGADAAGVADAVRTSWEGST